MICKLGKVVVAGAVVFAVAQTSDARLEFLDDFSGGGTVAAHNEGDLASAHPSYTHCCASDENMPTTSEDGTDFEVAPDSMLIGRGAAGFAGNYMDGFDQSFYGSIGSNKNLRIDILNGGSMSRDRKYTLTFKAQTAINRANNHAEGFPDALMDTHNSEFGLRAAENKIHHGFFASVESDGKGRLDFRGLLGYGEEVNMVLDPDGITTHEIVLDGPNHTVQLAVYAGEGSSRTGATPLAQSVLANLVDGPGYNMESIIDLDLLYDGSTWANGNRGGPRVDDIKLTSVAGDYIPEPVSLVLLGVGSLMLLRREKRA